MTILPLSPLLPLLMALALIALSPAATAAAQWQQRFLDLVLDENAAVTKAKWIASDVFWAAVPDNGEKQTGTAKALCKYVARADAPDDAHFRIHLWSAQQRSLGDGVVLGEAQCP